VKPRHENKIAGFRVGWTFEGRPGEEMTGGTREAKDPMKRSWAWILLLAASMAPASSGCAYLEARARDFQDSFRLSASVGPGIYANVTIGPVAAGVGYWQGYSAGSWGRLGVCTAREQCFA